MLKHDDMDEVYQLENGTLSDKIIEIKSVFKNGKRTVQPAFDRATGWWAGVDRLTDEEKKKLKYYVTVGNSGEQARLNTKMVLKDGMILNLSNEVDAINWKWLQHLPCLAKSYEAAQSSKAEFYIHIEGREATLKNNRTERVFKALEKVMNDPETNYTDRALLLGVDMEGEPLPLIKEFLLDSAQKNPDKVLAIYRDGAMKIHLLYLKAKRKGVITASPSDGVIKYGNNTILGITDEAAIAYLQMNEDILQLLEQDINPEYFSKQMTKAESAGKLTPAQAAAKAREARANNTENN